MSSDIGTAAPAFIGFGAAALALILSTIGSAYGMARAGAGLSASGKMNPEQVMKSLLTVILAGVLAIYGLIIGVLLTNQVTQPMNDMPQYAWDSSFRHLAAGLCVGFSGLGAGYAIGEVGYEGTKRVAQDPRLFVAMLLVLIFCEAIALFGLIVSLVLSG